MNRKLSALAVVMALLGCRTPAPIHDRAKEHNDFGVKYLGEGDLAKAQQRFELALEYNPEYPEPYSNLCVLWLKRNDLDKAKKMCIRALRLNNDFAEAHNTLGVIYKEEKAFGRAHDSFRAALRVNPGFLEARYNLCLTLWSLRRIGDSRVCYSKLIEVNPSVADPYHDLCEMDIEEKGFTQAIGRCSKAIELDPQFVQAHYHLGRAYQGGGKHCEAVEAYKSCLVIDEGHAECRNNLASAVRHCALQSPAIESIQEGGSDAPEAYYKKAIAWREKGLLPEAVRELEKCIKIDGRSGQCYCVLAEIKQRYMEKNEVSRLCRKCLNYSPEEQITPEHEMCSKLFE